MKFTITVKPNSRRPGIEKISETEYRVAVSATPVEGKANAAVIVALAGYFNVPKSSVEIISGHKGKNKMVRIGE